MPYITQMARENMDTGQSPESVGELNYAITSMVTWWLGSEAISYTRINAAIGVLEAAKLELYRRVAVPYENQKIVDNGDVYPPEMTGGQK